MVTTILFVLGLCLGSFINALVWRLQNKRDWVHERSECVDCRHKLSAKDLIPVISWLVLRGKCRYCKKPISTQYPIVELVTAGLFTVSYVAWPKPLTTFLLFKLVMWLLLLVVLTALSVYDLRTMLLPDKLVSFAAVLTIVYVLGSVIILNDKFVVMRDAFFGLIAFGGLFYLLFQVSKGKWIGGGDVKLGFVLGAWLGNPFLSLLAIFAASLLGTIIVAGTSVFKKIELNAKLPFGPLLIAGTIIVTLYGSQIIDKYLWYVLGA